MMVLLWMSALLGTLLFMRLVLRCPAGLVPVSSLCSTIALLYAFGLLGQLKAGAYTCLTLGLILLLVTARMRRATILSDLGSCLSSVPIAGFCFLMCWGLARFKDSLYVPWDSFSHWGVAPRVFMATGRFGSLNDPMNFPEYPPGASLLPYYVQQICGTSEGLATWAVVLLTLSGLLILFEDLRVVEVRQVGLRLAFAGYYYFLLHPESIESVYADANMAALFTAATLGCIWYVGQSAHNGLYLLPVCLVLSLTKPIGPLFAVFATVLGVACGVWRWASAPSGTDAKGRLSPPVLSALVPALLMLAALAANASWQGHLRKCGIEATGFPRLTFRQIGEAFGPTATPFQIGVRSNFKVAFLLQPAVPVPREEIPMNRLVAALTGTGFKALQAPSFLEILGSSTILVMCALVLESSTRRRLAIVGLFVGICLLLGVYLAILLILYLFRFSAYEASVLASFQRYVYAYMLPLGLFCAFLPIRALPRSPSAQQGAALLAIAACLFLLQPPPGEQVATVARTPVNFRDGIPIRRALRAALASVEDLVPKTSRVFVLYQGSSGLHYWMARYELFPRNCNLDHWSVGKPVRDGDTWTVDLDLSAFAAELAGYDFLFIGRPPDAGFWATYGPLFPVGLSHQGWRFFRVERTLGSEPSVRLVPIS